MFIEIIKKINSLNKNINEINKYFIKHFENNDYTNEELIEFVERYRITIKEKNKELNELNDLLNEKLLGKI